MVPSATIKTLRVMKKKCIFKVWSKQGWFNVYKCEIEEPKFGGVYRVYSRRRWIGKIAFEAEVYAINVALNCALGEDIVDALYGLR